MGIRLRHVRVHDHGDGRDHENGDARESDRDHDYDGDHARVHFSSNLNDLQLALKQPSFERRENGHDCDHDHGDDHGHVHDYVPHVNEHD